MTTEQTQAEAAKSGVAWAEREWDALVIESAGPGWRTWRPSDGDALPLVDHDDNDIRRELAEIANRAAARRWAELVDEYDSIEECAYCGREQDATVGVPAVDDDPRWC